MENEKNIDKLNKHETMLARHEENIKSLFQTTEQQGKLLDTVHKLNEVQIEILTEMKYIRTDISRVEKGLDCFKEDVNEKFSESEQATDVKVAGVKGELKGAVQDINMIKEKPTKRYEQVVTKILDVIIGIIIGGLILAIWEKIIK